MKMETRNIFKLLFYLLTTASIFPGEAADMAAVKGLFLNMLRV
jgi:hypothetical protein